MKTNLLAQSSVARTENIVKAFNANPLAAASGYAFGSEKKEQALVRSLVKPGMVAFDVGASQNAEVKRILFIRTDSIGDVVLASSMLPHLRRLYPNATIGVLCQERVSNLFTACPIVHTIIGFDYRKAAADEVYRKSIIAEIAEFNPDFVLNSLYSGDSLTESFSLSHRAPQTIGFAGDLSNIAEAQIEHAARLYSRRISSPGTSKPEMERYRDFLAGLGLKIPRLEPIVWTAPEDETVAEAFFQQHQLDRACTIAVFPKAQYAIKDYARYAEALRDLSPGFQFLIFGGAEVEASANQLAAQLPGSSINLAGKTTLRELAALLRRCRLYVGADSAGAHIACAVGTPNVVVLGGGHFGRFLPYSSLTTVACLPLDCYGCNWRCRFSRPHCIQDLAPRLLTEAIRQTLEKKSLKPRVFATLQSTWNPPAAGPKWTRVEPWLRGLDVEVVCETSVPAAPPQAVSKERCAPLVSAIVSTYKSERFIRGCLEDLEAQTIADQIEIIVVDSASPENERGIVEEFEKRFSNIVYIRTDERETVYGAWNRGIKAARGQYITNANTDDRHRHDALEILVRTLSENSDITLAYADCLVTRTENETFEAAHPIRRFDWLDFDPKALLLKGCFVGPQPMWRREVHDEHGYFDAMMVSAGDYEFWLRIARNRRFLHVKETLGLYLESPTSVEHSNQDHAKREVIVARERHKKVILKTTGKSKVPALNTLPLCANQGQLSEAEQLLKQKKLPQAWESTLATLRVRPFHPETFLLLAEIARVAGDSASARLCAQHAQSLAPAFKAAKKFIKGKFYGNAKPDWLVLPPEIENQNAKTRPRLSVCMIVKNEERFMHQCLASIKDLADQIVVVDTGSTDRTIEIAKEHGAEVHAFVWCDDFSAARNAALEHATGDWVLALDADEELPPENHAALRQLLNQKEVMGWRLPLFDVGREQDGNNYVPRLFRNAPGLYYISRVHEHVFFSVDKRRREWGLENRIGDAAIRHYGYTKELTEERGKVERNLRLLEQAVDEIPGEPMLLMNYGLELVRSDRLEEGLTKYRAAFEAMSKWPSSSVPPETRETLLTQYCTHLIRAKRPAEIPPLLSSPLARISELTASLHFYWGLAHMELQQFSSAAEQMRLCLAKRGLPVLTPGSSNIRKEKPRHLLARCLWSAKDTEGAEREFQAAIAEAPEAVGVQIDYAKLLHENGKTADALQLLNRFTSANPTAAAAWATGGQIALSQPELLEVAVDWTAVALNHHPDDANLLALRAEAFLLAGQLPDALPLWTKLGGEAKQPRWVAARFLCETALGAEASAPSDPLTKEVSQEFVSWYRKLIRFGAESVVFRLHENVDAIERVLPDAAKILRVVAAKLATAEAV